MSESQSDEQLSDSPSFVNRGERRSGIGERIAFRDERAQARDIARGETDDEIAPAPTRR
jgi:hypothetical protein